MINNLELGGAAVVEQILVLGMHLNYHIIIPSRGAVDQSVFLVNSPQIKSTENLRERNFIHVFHSRLVQTL